jgi:hypothetical protein
MMIKIKLRGALHTEILRDLERPHPFAAERVGFVAGRMGKLADDGRLILLTGYRSIPDDEYVNDPSVGARIGSDAITWAMQAAYHGRPRRKGVFHIHLHSHRGPTGMSGTDRREIPQMIPGFQSVGREAAHGIIILSLSHGSACVWLPGLQESIQAACMAVIGSPISVFESGREL